MTRFTRVAAAVAALAAVTAPTLAAAQPYGYGSTEYQRGYNANGYDSRYDNRYDPVRPQRLAP